MNVFVRATGARRISITLLFISVLAATSVLGGCDRNDGEVAPEIRPVRVVVVEERAGGEVITLSGTVEAQTEVDLGFRIGGRVVERFVNVGDRVKPGQIIARLDAQDEGNSLRAAKASLSAAEGQLVEAEANYARQRQLLDRGFTTRMRYDEVVQMVRTLRSQVDAANAQVLIAQNRLDDTSLFADAPGEVTSRAVEAGQVVTPGQMVVRLARKEGRDAVFDVPASLLSRGRRDASVTVALSIDPAVNTVGRVREVSPQADPTTGAFRIRVGLSDSPPEMRLGSTVVGRMRLEGSDGISIPPSALARLEGQPAVWIFDAAANTVSKRNVQVALHRTSEVVLLSGVSPGEIVVTAGVQTLRPGQRVRLLGQN
ncbi:MAG: efflux RND transporter periplasmic adaptor subunit [Beijerinckiaceae bacterium]|nr:efflux RND transporter periplasmic adaptor subunit [Beijerinckiaceae bacterium]